MDIEQQVESAGHEVVGMAVDLASCQKLALENRPDIVLMDLRLKNADSGQDAANWLRATLDIGCVFISGNLDEATRDRLSAVEPLAYIGKPILPAKLVDTLRELSRSESFRK